MSVALQNRNSFKQFKPFNRCAPFKPIFGLFDVLIGSPVESQAIFHRAFERLEPFELERSDIVLP
jgi:hypothetical protein